MKSPSISNRINLGFAAMTVVIVIGSMLAYLAVSALGDGYKRYRVTAKQTIAINLFIEDLFQARVAALKYRVSPSATNRDEVRSNINEIIADAPAATEFDQDPIAAGELRDIVDLARTYLADFMTQSEYSEIVAQDDQEMEKEGNALLEILTDLGAIGAVNEDSVFLGETSQAQTSILRALIDSKQLLAKDSDDAYEQMVSHLATADEKLANAQARLEESGLLGWERAAQQSTANARTQLEKLQSISANMQQHIVDAAALQSASLDQIGPQMQDRLELMAEAIVAEQDALGPQGQAVVDRILRTTPIVGGLAFLIAVAAAFLVGRWVTLPVRSLAQNTNALAQGNTDIKIEGTEDQHELGAMARALEVFRDAHIERTQIMAEREQKALAEKQAVAALSESLQSMAAGHLDVRVTQQLGSDYEALRQDFNTALGQLEQTISGVISASHRIEGNAASVNVASQDLSRRTENQAATLEETAAALDELTSSVKSSADRVKEVASTVNVTRSEAKDSGVVVSKAVSAMGKIEQSSQQISQITQVISDISFQTNLLALNAGVEAARAGEAGRGFAVVASEVRALAQRSSQAAKEVSELISTSSMHVEEGTKLVNSAGAALGTFIEKVDHISDLIADIASNAAEQASGISEINIGVNQLDQVTQQNAGMVESSHQQGQQLVNEAKELDQLVKAFHLSAGLVEVSGDRPLNNVVRMEPSLAPKTVDVSAVPRAVAVGDAETWEDF